jgi:PiT family inorganic phosphate transporter
MLLCAYAQIIFVGCRVLLKYRLVIVTLLFLAVIFVAYANGANDNFKGVASIYGSGTASFRTSLWWGMLTTLAGAIAALWLAGALIKTFGGKGLVPDALASSQLFVFPVALGTALTCMLATRLGFPISTTHALVGALVGAGIASSGWGTVNWEALGSNFFQPLLLSPLIALAVGPLIYFILKSVRLAPKHRTRTLDALHFLSGGAVGFARGLNDTPKMAALLLVAKSLEVQRSVAVIAVAMTLGGLLHARRVAETLSKKITGMNPGQGFCANLATAAVVTVASIIGKPVSTTHVSVGTLMGIGLVTKQAKLENILQIALAWVITLPCGAVLAALGVVAVRMVF